MANVFVFVFNFSLTAFLLLYDTELSWHKRLCSQYLSCLDFTACTRFVKWSCFWVGHTWTLVCKCYLNLCFIIVCGMCVQTMAASCLPSRGPAVTTRVRRQGGRGLALEPVLMSEDVKRREDFYVLKMVLCQEGPVFLPSPLFFKSPVGGKIGDMHGGNL